MFFNAGGVDVDVRLPKAPNGGTWRKTIVTALTSSNDFVDEKTAPKMKPGVAVLVSHKSLIVAIGLVSKLAKAATSMVKKMSVNPIGT